MRNVRGTNAGTCRARSRTSGAPRPASTSRAGSTKCASRLAAVTGEEIGLESALGSGDLLTDRPFPSAPWAADDGCGASGAAPSSSGREHRGTDGALPGAYPGTRSGTAS